MTFCACQIAKSKWQEGSRRLENSARVFEFEAEEDVEEGDGEVEDNALAKEKEEEENRRRQEIYRGQEHWADDIR